MTQLSTWLITGASSGIGKEIALAAIGAGFRVIGTTRDLAKAESSFPEFSATGGVWKQLDPGQSDAFESFSKCAEEYNVDVLVNNAGYFILGAVEDISEEEFRSQMEVNFYGPLRTVRACLPAMRAKKSGHIVLVSSGAGFIARPARGAYAASKFAIEAIHESLADEVKTLGIKVLIVEPGAFQTPFASRVVLPAKYAHGTGFSDAYKDTAVEQMFNIHENMRSSNDLLKGDPAKAAEAIVDAVTTEHGYLRLILGPDCVDALELKIGRLKSDLDACRDVAMSTNRD